MSGGSGSHSLTNRASHQLQSVETQTDLWRRRWASPGQRVRALVQKARQAHPQGAGEGEGQSCWTGAHGSSKLTPDPAQPKEGSDCWKSNKVAYLQDAEGNQPGHPGNDREVFQDGWRFTFQNPESSPPRSELRETVEFSRSSPALGLVHGPVWMCASSPCLCGRRAVHSTLR